ncbi:hypothetical protein BKA66DRAFT_421266 [Pyrenochaeta sp. MPI-SDFR-AT-0127]|nr:hypothetical protein BKA66DRAFT_421266 [Pyrenochaeta sp. MPI-SDFR-AT-0127]
MLWAEPAGETIQARNPTENSQVTVHPNPAITTGRYGQPIYSQIRRFVIVKVNRKQYFVYACPITTYGNRGVLKPGCNASEHVMVYRNGTRPELIPGERERGMTKDPIAINIEDAQEEMHPASRLRLGKITSIEWNVKVRNIGMVIPEHRSRLMAYYRAEQNNGFDNDNDDDTNYQGPQYPGPYATQNTYQY